MFDWDDALVAGRPIPCGLLEAQMESPRYPVHYVNSYRREPTLAQPWHNVWFWKYVGQTLVSMPPVLLPGKKKKKYGVVVCVCS